MVALLLPILLPAALGLLALFVPGRRHATGATLGVAGALALLAAGLAALGLRGGFARPWLALGPLEVDFALRNDAFSSWAVVLVGLLSSVAALYSAGWWRGRGGAPGRHAALLLLAGAGGAAVLLADDFLVLILGWELVSLTLFLLAVSGREEAGPGAAKAYVLLGLGDLALMLGAVLVGLERVAAGAERPWSLSGLAEAPLATSGAATGAYLLFLVAAMAKAGAMPLHSWIPTMSTSTHASVMAYLPGSLDKLLGIYLLVRVSVDWFVPDPALRGLMMWIGAVTLLCGVTMALVQHDLRRLLSFHAVSQVGYMLLGIGTGTVVGAMGAVFHMVNNALYKSCLFLGAGSVERETGTVELDRLGGLGRTMPVTFGCMLVAALSISGVPPFNGFASKWLVYQGCVAADEPLLLVAALFGSVLTLASFVKVLHSVFFGARPARLDEARESGGAGMSVAMVVLAVLCVGLGVGAGWPLERYIGPAVGLPAGGGEALTGAPAAWVPLHGDAVPPPLALPRGTYSPAAVTGLLVLGSLLALGVGYLGAMRARRRRPVFVGGGAFDRELHRFPGTEFYRTVREVPLLGRAIALGESGRLDPYEISARAGAPVVDLLRRLHTGLLQDYLAWGLVGTAVVTLFLWWS
ncbi:MAG TPA: proton-conducting transporter membrane subunit [Thermoanaerobaculia bacterium]|nr:proton-conducting transporter membrane subunit [Thermoanaerobaculia bacterium]